MGREFAGILGLVAFSTVVLRAAIAGEAESALLTATIGLFAFAAAGWMLGTIADSTIEQSVRARFAAEMQAAEEAAKEPAKS